MTFQFRIASPCSADRNKMKGDDRARFCEDCRLHVYNFSSMTPPEIEALISQREEIVVVGERAQDHRSPVNKLFSKIRRMI